MGDVLNILLLQNTLRTATPVVLAALGCLMTQHVNITNIGIEGMMLTGAFFAVLGSYFAGSWVAGIACALLVGLLLGLFYYVFVIKFKSDEFIIGVALNIFAGGLTVFLLRNIFDVKGSFSDPAIVPLPTIEIPLIKDIPVIGPLLSGNTLLVYVSWLLVPVCWAFIYKTPMGFHLRASGEYPDALTAAGKSPERMKCLGQRAVRTAQRAGGRAPVAGLSDHVFRKHERLARVCGVRLRHLWPRQPAEGIFGGAAVRLHRGAGPAHAKVHAQRPDRHGTLCGDGGDDGSRGADGAQETPPCGVRTPEKRTGRPFQGRPVRSFCICFAGFEQTAYSRAAFHVIPLFIGGAQGERLAGQRALRADGVKQVVSFGRGEQEAHGALSRHQRADGILSMDVIQPCLGMSGQPSIQKRPAACLRPACRASPRC